nr:MAG TPA: replisome organizer [Caudoviricetes sp.]
MAEVKWIKIVTDIFDDEKMLLIDGLPEHDAIIVIWFKLLCLAGKQNNGGVFMISDKIAFTDEMLATIFHRPLNTVRLALNVFEKYRMIEIVDDTITIPNWSKHQSLDSYERRKENDRLRQTKKRELQRALIAEKSVDCHVTSRDMSRDVTHIESEKDKSKNEESDVEEDENNASLSAPQSECPYSKIRELYHQICISYPMIKAIDGNRRKAVAARWRTYKSLDTFKALFSLAEASPFLKGENDRNWAADFDWMMKATNFAKILEHRYEERSANTGKPSGVLGALQRMHEEAARNDEAGSD